ncbi:hypothetical protein J6590_047552 [Homalodisca vitripennis]|nr:hypothetical protein J6590_047552 [Homalodisca vitripennis]
MEEPQNQARVCYGEKKKLTKVAVFTAPGTIAEERYLLVGTGISESEIPGRTYGTGNPYKTQRRKTGHVAFRCRRCWSVAGLKHGRFGIHQWRIQGGGRPLILSEKIILYNIGEEIISLYHQVNNRVQYDVLDTISKDGEGNGAKPNIHPDPTSSTIATLCELLLGWLTVERSCPCKQPAWPAVGGGGSEVTFKPLVSRLFSPVYITTMPLISGVINSNLTSLLKCADFKKQSLNRVICGARREAQL